MNQSTTSQIASWEDYFIPKTGGIGHEYQYIDTSVIELPKDLPQPPSDYPVSFSDCYYLINIDALAKWDTSMMTSTAGMFNHCRSLADISSLRFWNLSNVTNMSYMFNCCYELSDVSAIKMWDISKVKRMRYIFNGCHKLPHFARFEVYDQQTFNFFVERYIWSLSTQYLGYYNQSDDGAEPYPDPEIEEEEEYYEPWDETTMGPYPFPENGDSLTATVLPGTNPEVSCNNFNPVDDDLSMTLTPEMVRRLLDSAEDDY